MKILGISGSPREDGNTEVLLKEAIKGAREEGAEVEVVFLRDKTISPCLEIYRCKVDGRCVIEDDFQDVAEKMVQADALILASPIFFRRLQQIPFGSKYIFPPARSPRIAPS